MDSARTPDILGLAAFVWEGLVSGRRGYWNSKLGLNPVARLEIPLQIGQGARRVSEVCGHPRNPRCQLAPS